MNVKPKRPIGYGLAQHLVNQKCSTRQIINGDESVRESFIHHFHAQFIQSLHRCSHLHHHIFRKCHHRRILERPPNDAAGGSSCFAHFYRDTQLRIRLSPDYIGARSGDFHCELFVHAQMAMAVLYPNSSSRRTPDRLSCTMVVILWAAVLCRAGKGNIDIDGTVAHLLGHFPNRQSRLRSLSFPHVHNRATPSTGITLDAASSVIVKQCRS